MAVSCKSHVLSQKLTPADRAFDLPRFLPPGVFQIVEAVPDVLHDDLLFIVHDETCSILAVKLTFKQEQVRGERFRFAVHVRGNLKIALVNDIPRSLVTGDLDAVAIPAQHTPQLRFFCDCPHVERILLMRKIFESFNRSAGVADVAANAAAEGVVCDALCVHRHLPAAGTREVSTRLLLGKAFDQCLCRLIDHQSHALSLLTTLAPQSLPAHSARQSVRA